MKYTLQTELDLPREKVIELFDNPDNIRKWQPGLVSFEHKSGERGRVGAKSLLKYKMGKRQIEMVETITKRALPDEFSGTYEAKGVWNSVVNRFQESGPAKTKWEVESEFQCSGLFMKVMATFMPGSFKKETQRHMQRFKDFAESEYQKNQG